MSHLPSKHNVIRARSIVNVQNDQACVQILNPTHEWLYLKANEPVARVDSLEKQAILCEIDDCSPKSISTLITNSPSCNTKPHSKTPSDTSIPCINELQTDTQYIETAISLGVDLSHSTLTPEQKRRLLVLIGKNRDVFATCTAESCHTNLYPHKIITKDVPPVRRPQYRTNPEQKAEIERQTRDLEEHRIISK